MECSIQKWGNSQGIRIPKAILKTLCWSEKDVLKIETKGNRLVVQKVLEQPIRKNIKELFADYNEEYIPQDIDWGEPQGRELW